MQQTLTGFEELLMPVSKWSFAVFALCLILPTGAYDPPTGGEALPVLVSPVMMGGGASVASAALPMADVLNPAAAAAIRRINLDASYGALVGLDALIGLGGETGLGHVFNLGAAFPQDYGVWTTRFGFVHSPFNGLPWGTLFSGRVGMAKELYPELLQVGAAVDVTLGYNAAFGWGLGLDLGMQGTPGDLGFLKDFRWGIALRNIGKAYSAPGSVGMLGTGQPTGYDSAFTLAVGVAADFVQAAKPGIAFGGSLDLTGPAFQNLLVNIGLQLSIKDRVFVRSGWDFNLREHLAGVDQGLLPSFGIGGSFALTPTTQAGRMTTTAAPVPGPLPPASGPVLPPASGPVLQPASGPVLQPAFGAYQLPGGVWAFSLGTAMALGAMDKEPPVIRVVFPQTEFGPAYISPNGDGVQDSVAVKVSISDQRHVHSYVFRVRDTAGRTVRVIQDQETRPSGGGFKEFLARLAYVRSSVVVPEELIWDGRSDSGLVVPDGLYTIEIEAYDDNGNQANAGPYSVVVDNTAPAVNAAIPDRAAANIFSPDGDGEKDDITIAQTGTIEDLWIGRISDAGGTVIRSWEFRSASPGDIVWDGRNAAGDIVVDGIYTYRIQATDRAGNHGMARVEPIVVNTQQAPISVSVDLPAFSPNGDGILDVLTITPMVTVRTAVTAWSLAIFDGNQQERWSISGQGLGGFLERFHFLGRDSAGTVLPEGRYRARLTVQYENGYNPEAWSTPFVIDLTAPSVSVARPVGIDADIFSPDGDGNKEQFSITQSGSIEDLWSAEILNAAGQVIRRWEFRMAAPSGITWDGRNQTGTIVPDGTYLYRIQASDRAGNRASARIDGIIVDTRQPACGLSLDLPVFSPNGDGKKDILTITTHIASRDGLRTWQLAVVDANGLPRRTWSGNGPERLSEFFSFDGRNDAGATLPEGSYRARLLLRYANGYAPEVWSGAFSIDITAPVVTISAPDTPLIFNPAGDGSLASIAIVQHGSVEDLWIAEVLNEAGTVVRHWEFRHTAPATIVWDGTTFTGLALADGRYTYRIAATDPAGNTGGATLQDLIVDTRRPVVALTIDMLAFSPNGDGVQDVLTITPDVRDRAGIVAWTLAVSDSVGIERWTLRGNSAASLQNSYSFTGQSNSGLPLADGTYKSRLQVRYTSGHEAVAWSAPFIIDVTPPRATLTVDQTVFNPLGDARTMLVIGQNGSVEELWLGRMEDAAGRVVRTWQFSGRPTAVVRWDGFDDAGSAVIDGTYTYRLSATDQAGNSVMVQSPPLTLNTEEKDVRLSLDRRAFSPNGDGINDTITIKPVSVASNIRQWRLEIRNLSGNAVRVFTGGNILPASIVWDGADDHGMLAADGIYLARLRVEYSTSESKSALSAEMVLDTRAPHIRLEVSDTLFSPNGDGRKDELRFIQDSDPGDNWEGHMLDEQGRSIRRWTWRDRATSFEWDGRNTQGAVVPDGTYRYEVWSEDLAGNRTRQVIAGIVVDNRPVPIAVSTSDTGLNPVGDKAPKQVMLTLTVALRQGIEAWRLDLVDQDGTVRRSYGGPGTTPIPGVLYWDGKSDSGTIVEGLYTAVFTVDYFKGDRSQASSARILVYTAVPKIRLDIVDGLFSPNGDGRKDVVRFIQDSEPGDDWQGHIVDDRGHTVRSWFWPDRASNFEWDGTDAFGYVVPDGAYRYIVWAEDPAGIRFEYALGGIVVDNRPSPVFVTVNVSGFNPNAAGRPERLSMVLALGLREGIDAWRLELVDQGGTVRRTFGGSDGTVIPPVLEWDGKSDNDSIIPGIYQAVLTVDYAKGDRSQARSSAVILYTRVPVIRIRADDRLFSPNGDGRKDVVRISQDSEPGDDWQGLMVDERNRPVRSWRWEGRATNFEWDGRNEQGSIVPDGTYRYVVWSLDAAGKRIEQSLDGIVVDNRPTPVTVTAGADGFSPGGEGRSAVMPLLLNVAVRDGIETWQLAMVDQTGAIRRTFRGSASTAIPARLDWNGRSDNGSVIQGSYTAVFTVDYAKGDRSQASSKGFVLDSLGPRVGLNVTPALFSPDGDGVNDDLHIAMAVADSSRLAVWRFEIIEVAVFESAEPARERLFFSWSGDGAPPERLVWDGRSPRGELVEAATDYLYRLYVSDEWGNETKVEGPIAVDVLVIREADRLRMKVPSIVFRPGFADFNELPAEVAARNQKVIQRVAQILNRYGDYRIQIEGHANSDAKIAGADEAAVNLEEQRDVQPLSAARAEAVRRRLEESGVAAWRMSAIGLGSSRPAVPFSDAENRWKNRRVEFILVRD
jgi:flagellar hook assembly protein FlgD/outer membrane protein OmpA-like peptidoglycan-associated protein